ncbi:diacylglycerol/lipid kinase family protein [Filimonas effusa]|nr:YegS/Rv2252/BmrU family lipid kinase [Filimonas effusa]
MSYTSETLPPVAERNSTMAEGGGSKGRKRKFVYLVNPISGTSKKEALVKLIKSISKQRKLSYEIIPTSSTGNYDYLADRIIEEEITDVVIVGGDGTVNQVIGALRGLPVRFGIIPFGSGNGLALSAGIPKKPKEAFELILSGNAHPVDGFMVNDKFSCMLTGLGFDAQVAHDFAARSSRGLMTYTQQSIINYFKAQPYQFEIVLDNISFFTDAFFLCVANSNQFGNNFTIAPLASLQDGLLDIVIVQKMSKARLPFAVLRQIRGNNKLQQLVEDMANKNVLYFQTPSITIKNLKLAPMHIDGEPRETEESLKIEILPRCFQLIRNV